MAPQVSYAHLGALHYFPPLSTRGQADAFEKVVLEPVMVDVHGMLLAVCGLSVLAGQEGDPLARVSIDGEVERAAIALLILHAPIEFQSPQALQSPQAGQENRWSGGDRAAPLEHHDTSDIRKGQVGRH